MMVESGVLPLAEAVSATCLKTAVEAYEAALMDGLCEDGAYEAAMDAIRSLDPAAIDARQAEQVEY